MTGEPATTAAGSHRTRRKRTSNACMRCRDRKVKCSGSWPCTNCSRRSVECQFDPDDRKIVVSERFLNELKQKSGFVRTGEQLLEAPAKRPRHNLSGSPDQPQSHGEFNEDEEAQPPTPTSGTSSAHVIGEDEAPMSLISPSEYEDEHGGLRNPLITGSLNFITDSIGRRRWLGPSSTWAYSRQVIRMMRVHLGHHENHDTPTAVDAQAFNLDWPSNQDLVTQRTADIPSLDYAVYLTNTVKFYLCQTYHVFDENSFMTGLYDFYKRSPSLEPASETRLWYIQFLLIMALGKALLAPITTGNSPAGSGLVRQALELLPDAHGLYQDPVLSVELLCGLSLYLQSIDHRNSAYLYIGQALRIALTQGLHRELDTEHLSDHETIRLRCVWWTLYILDRKFSSLMGAPNSVRDDDITVRLPHPSNASDKLDALGVHVRLSKLLAKVLNTVYRVDGKLDRSVLKDIQDVLREMARLLPELTSKFEFKLDNSEPASRVSATLNLCYHQCIVLATRPILVCLLEDVLTMRRNNDHGIANPIKALIKTSFKSAKKSLCILSFLQSQQLLETFLPFDLEQAFSSAFVLTIMSALPVLPGFGNKDHIDTTFSILDTMISRGNVVARFRKTDLQELQEAMGQMQSGTRSPLESLPDTNSHVLEDTVTGSRVPRMATAATDLASTGLIDRVPTVGSATDTASEQMLPIAEFIEWEPTLFDIGSNQLPDDWLWADAGAAPSEFSGTFWN